ncbi:MAG: nucleotidyltransferase family protein [Pseudomonadaceae bacterium]|nr:nucleotidyltransferase family protein [Pseudomonadaceae bacterium]
MSAPITSAMILAAGMGSRLRPLTDMAPKPLINVGGQPVILRALAACKAAGIERVVINTHYLGRMVEATVNANRMGLKVMFSHEETLLETGGGIKKALPLLGDAPFLVVNSDAVWREDMAPLLRPLMTAFNPKKHDALMAVVPLKTVAPFRTDGGDFIFDKRSKKLTRPPARQRDKANVVFAGVHVTHPAFVAAEEDERFSLVKPWDMAASVGRLHGFWYDGPWADMGTHSGLEYARRLAHQDID